MDFSGLDGTQDPPPPRAYPDALAGLVTGEVRYRPAAVTPVVPLVVPVVPPPVAPAPEFVRPARRAPVRKKAPQPRVGGQPVQHNPHAGLARRIADQAPVQAGHPVQPGLVAPTKRGGGLIGWLVALAVLGGLLFTVAREIIRAVVDLLR